MNFVGTVSPITGGVEFIGGNRINVIGAVPESINTRFFEPAPSVADALSGVDLTFPNRLFPEEPIHPMRRGPSADPTWTAPRISGAGKPRAADPGKSELA